MTRLNPPLRVTAEEVAQLIHVTKGRALHLVFGPDEVTLHPACKWPIPLIAEWRGAEGGRVDLRDVDQGLYRVYWKSGGSSLAAIGITSSGGRWIAPTNWIDPAPLTASIINRIAFLEGPGSWEGSLA